MCIRERSELLAWAMSKRNDCWGIEFKVGVQSIHCTLKFDGYPTITGTADGQTNYTEAVAQAILKALNNTTGGERT